MDIKLRTGQNIMHDLTEKEWPVIYRNGKDVSILTYYIGQYLVPAFIGKTMTLSFRNILFVNWIWASIGLFLVWLLFCFAVRANSTYKQLFVLLLLILAGGMMTLQEEIGHALFPDDILLGMEGWRDYFLCYGRYMLQYRTNFISIRWAYGQTIVPWICTAILYQKRYEIKNYLILIIPIMLFGTFSFVSIVILAIATYVSYIKKESDVIKILKNTFSIQNCLIFFSLGLVFFLYFIGFMTQEKPVGVEGQVVKYLGKDIGIYFVFILGSFGLYALCIFKEYKTNSIFVTAVVVMSILPFIKFGAANDLLMGACICLSFVIYLACAEFIFENGDNRSYIKRRAILVVLLCIGFIKPSVEIYKCLSTYNYSEFVPNDAYVTLEGFANRERQDIGIDIQYNYYTYDAYNEPFMKYIGRD